MAAAYYKIQFIFNCGKQGWSEIVYRNANSAREARDASAGLAAALADCLGQPAYLEGYKAIQEPVFGQPPPRVAAPDFHLLGPPAENGLAQLAGDAIGMRLTADNSRFQRVLWLRAIPDEWLIRLTTNPNRFRTNIGASNDAVNAVGNAIAGTEANPGRGFLIKALSRTPEIVNQQPITSVAAVPDLPEHTFIVTAGAHGIEPFQRFSIARPPKKGGFGWEDMHGVYTALSVPAVNQIEILYRAASPATYDGSAVTRRRVLEYPQITGAGEQFLRTRQTGRAFFVPAGKSRSRRR